MTCTTSINDIFASSFRENFDLPCITDYVSKETLAYGDFARRVARLHVFFAQCDVRPGDKIALLGKNNIYWVTAFIATVTYGAVVVPILSEFNPKDAQHIVNHSDSVLLFVSDTIWEHLHFDEMPHVRAVLSLDSRKCLADTDRYRVTKWINSLTRRFRQRYPEGFRAEDVVYPVFDDRERTVIINYTSGTTGFSKGVMLPERSLLGNMEFGIKSRLHYKGSRALSFLPLAHAYGCAFDMLVPLAVGTHITLLGRTPSPRLLLAALAEVKPSLIICVPLILEKIYRRMIQPALTRRSMRWVLAMPFMDRAVYPKIRKKLIDAFGGEFSQVIVGGAPLNREVEEFLHRIGFPFTVGFGMTECGPLISYTPWENFIVGSSGRTLEGIMEARILGAHDDGQGEILVRGTNVMTGYYKNPQATEDVLDESGWLHTGDMGTLGGPDGQTVFIRGRYKTMILTSTGQNVYPEEIESKLNNMPYVAESVVVERDGRLVALVYPDSGQTDADNISDAEMPRIMERTRKELNGLLAPYERISAIELMPDEFEKTPKRSIKRYLYK